MLRIAQTLIFVAALGFSPALLAQTPGPSPTAEPAATSSPPAAPAASSPPTAAPAVVTPAPTIAAPAASPAPTTCPAGQFLTADGACVVLVTPPGTPAPQAGGEVQSAEPEATAVSDVPSSGAAVAPPPPSDATLAGPSLALEVGLGYGAIGVEREYVDGEYTYERTLGGFPGLTAGVRYLHFIARISGIHVTLELGARGYLLAPLERLDEELGGLIAGEVGLRLQAAGDLPVYFQAGPLLGALRSPARWSRALGVYAGAGIHIDPEHRYSLGLRGTWAGAAQGGGLADFSLMLTLPLSD